MTAHDTVGVDTLLVPLCAPVSDRFGFYADMMAVGLAEYVPHPFYTHFIKAIYLHSWHNRRIVLLTPGEAAWVQIAEGESPYAEDMSEYRFMGVEEWWRPDEDTA